MGRSRRRSPWASGAAALAVLSSCTLGCGDDSSTASASTSSASTATSAGAPQGTAPGTDDGGSLPPGPPLQDPSAYSPDELVITGADARALESAVTAEGGTVTVADPAIELYVARFPVADVDELVALRDRLRAAGLDASLSPVEDDPTT